MTLLSLQVLARYASPGTTRRVPLLSKKLNFSANRFCCLARSVPVREVRPWVKHAFVFSVMFSGTKAALADIWVQTGIENSAAIDWRRVKIFSLFGFIFCGVWQYFLYNKLFPMIVPGIDRFLALPIRARFRDVQGLKGVAIQCFIDNFFCVGVCYFPVFYTLKLYLEGSGSMNPMLGVKRYIQTWPEDLWNAMKVWIPAQTFNFLIFPIWARVTFTALVSFGFTAYVSYLRGAPEKFEEKATAKVEEVPETLLMQIEAHIITPIGEVCGIAEDVSQNMIEQMELVNQ